MFKPIPIKLILAISLILTQACTLKESSDKINDFLPVYNCVEINKEGEYKLVTVLDTVLSCDATASIQERAEILAGEVSERYFRNLEIRILPLDTTGKEKILRIDLKEKEDAEMTTVPSWYQYFQGTSGGTETTQILLANFLQKQYKEDWVDKVKFLYNGEEFGEWDHISLGVHSRYNFNNNKYIESY